MVTKPRKKLIHLATNQLKQSFVVSVPPFSYAQICSVLPNNTHVNLTIRHAKMQAHSRLATVKCLPETIIVCSPLKPLVFAPILGMPLERIAEIHDISPPILKPLLPTAFIAVCICYRWWVITPRLLNSVYRSQASTDYWSSGRRRSICLNVVINRRASSPVLIVCQHGLAEFRPGSVAAIASFDAV